jgi:hypothetical protein
MTTLATYLKKLSEENGGEFPPFKPGVILMPEQNRISLYLENVPFYSEWIEGEAADVSIYRAEDDGRFVGGFFPMSNFADDFLVTKLTGEPISND